MKFKITTLVLITIFSVSCTQQNSINTVEDVISQFERSLNDKDLGSLNDVFSKEAKIYEQGSVDESWEKYRDGHLGKEVNAMKELNFQFDIKDKLVGLDMALLRGDYVISGQLQEQAINSKGLATLALKIEDGMWKIVHLQFSRSCKTSDSTHDHGAHKAQKSSDEKKPLSPKTAAMANVGDAHVHIDYSSPRVRGRQIWGGLVAYDNVWATGAHRATTINFPVDVTINKVKVPAGKYGFFTIPRKSEWILIVNKNWDQHMADEYQPSEDIVRIKVKPEILKENQEELLYQVEEIDNETGRISVSWEKLKVSFEFRVNN